MGERSLPPTIPARASIVAALEEHLTALPAQPVPEEVRRGLDLTELHSANIARQAEWCPDQVPDLSFRGNELAGETGEACNVIKKLERERQGWRGSRASLDDLAQELADVVICADLCAVTAGIDLSAAVIAKFNATSEKQGLSTLLPHHAKDATAEARAEAGAGGDESDSAYRLGKEDGASEAIQRVADWLGLDSDYRWSTDPERRQEGPVELLAKIVKHVEDLRAAAPRQGGGS